MISQLRRRTIRIEKKIKKLEESEDNFRLETHGKSLIPIESHQLEYFFKLQKDEIDGAHEAFSVFLMYMHQMYFGPRLTRKYIFDTIGLEGERLEGVLEMLKFIFTIEE